MKLTRAELFAQSQENLLRGFLIIVIFCWEGNFNPGGKGEDSGILEKGVAEFQRHGLQFVFIIEFRFYSGLESVRETVLQDEAPPVLITVVSPRQKPAGSKLELTRFLDKDRFTPKKLLDQFIFLLLFISRRRKAQT
ncbi:MAG: hypothetical protein QNK37_25355 [Acidobacteriota bacterium]|nr:hypothetical protein [Acidobacteriota bacterium]